MRKDAAQAFMDVAAYHAELNDIYKFYMPFRRSISGQSDTGQGHEGASRTNHLFDGTGLSAAFTFAGNMQADWIPPHGEFFSIGAGPLVPEDQHPEMNLVLQKITRVVHAVLPRVHDTIHEMFTDLFAGTGALLINPGNARFPVRGQAIPINEIAMRDGPFGEVWYRWWKRSFLAGELPSIWPDGMFSDRLNTLIRDNKTVRVVVTQATIWDEKAQRWCLTVFADGDGADDYIWYEEFRTSPWSTPRFFKVPGESMGRGLAHLGLPFVKTANKSRELALTAAAFAVLGLWIRRDDGVFNPDTAVMAPGRMWTVQSTGGVMGPSIARLPVPQDFDIASIVMADEREQIKRVLLDDELPDHQDPVRSATEIAGRLRRYARLKGGAGSRLSTELIISIIDRVIECLEPTGMLPMIGNGPNAKPTAIVIDQILTKVTVTAPAAAAQSADKIERAVNWIQMITMLMGPQAVMLSAKVEELLPQLGRWGGVEEQFIRSKIEKKELMGLLAQMMEQQQKAAAKPPSPAEQQQAVVNGGAA